MFYFIFKYYLLYAILMYFIINKNNSILIISLILKYLLIINSLPIFKCAYINLVLYNTN